MRNFFFSSCKWGAYFLGVFLFLIVTCEIFLRFISPPRTKYYIFPPHTHKIYCAQPKLLPGVDGINHFTINSQGLRSKEIAADVNLRILILGGSSAECIILDDSEAWPQIIENELNQKQRYGKVWVGNTGRSGISSYENVLVMRHLPDQIGSVCLAIVCIGANDAAMAMANVKWEFDEDDRYARTYFIISQKEKSFPQNTALFAFCQDMKRLWLFSKIGILQNGDYFQWVVKSQKARMMDRPHLKTMPNLDSYLQQYKKNLNEIVRLSNEKGIKLVFVTQPLLFKKGLSTEEEASLGGYGITSFFSDTTKSGNSWYSSATIEKINNQYHQVTKNVCEKNNVPCIDAANLFPAKLEYFYDGLHFTEKGSHAFAQFLVEEIGRMNLLESFHSQ